jgi:hypothetical protein
MTSDFDDTVSAYVSGWAPTMIKILFLAANPKDTDRLRLDEEVRAIKERLRLADLRDQFVVEQEHAVRVTNLQGYMLQHRPNIVHFSGHGSRAGEIIVEDAKGASKRVSPAALKRTFAVLKDNVRCVVLNACYTEAQAKGIGESIDCVVGMSRAIGDDSAIAFAAGFYQGLGYGRSIQDAFELGCGQIDLEGLGDEEVPKLTVATGTDAKELYLTGNVAISPPKKKVKANTSDQEVTPSRHSTGSKAKPVELFFSYSHKDEKLRDQLEEHLANLKRQGVISGWHDRKIGAGKEWAGEISEHLESAQIILLLVSSSFLASDYCHDVEMRRALKRHKRGQARVIPVILRSVDWHGAEFGKLQALPRDGKPVTSWKNRDAAFTDIARGIREAVNSLTSEAVDPSAHDYHLATLAASSHRGDRTNRVKKYDPFPAILSHAQTSEKNAAVITKQSATTGILSLIAKGEAVLERHEFRLAPLGTIARKLEEAVRINYRFGSFQDHDLISVVGKNLFQVIAPDNAIRTVDREWAGWATFYIDDSLINFPWQILHTGSDFVRNKVFIGFQIASDIASPHAPRRRKQSTDHIRIFIISQFGPKFFDPMPFPSLSGFDEEARHLLALAGGSHAAQINVVSLSDDSEDAILAQLAQDNDIIHISSMTSIFDSQTGFISEDLFVDVLSLKPPAIVLQLSCGTGFVGPSIGPSIRDNIAIRLAKNGTCFIDSSNWMTFQEGKNLTDQFYSKVFHGISIGEAFASSVPPGTWYGYRLVGDPETRLFMSGAEQG